jgi:hypothetical protein
LGETQDVLNEGGDPISRLPELGFLSPGPPIPSLEEESVVAAGEYATTVWTEPGAVYFKGTRREAAHFLAGLSLLQTEETATAAAKDKPTIGRKRHRENGCLAGEPPYLSRRQFASDWLTSPSPALSGTKAQQRED